MTSILKNHTILYVEDEPSIRANITEYLESYFATVYTAADGTQALEQYRLYRPDVLLLDIHLPYIDGLTVAKKVRQTDSYVKIIMLTAHTEKEKLLAATELKLTKYLIKPIAPREFKKVIRLLAQELSQGSRDFIRLSDRTRWDNSTKKLYLDGHIIILTEKESKLLELFITHISHPVSYEEIMIALWKDSWDREISIGSVKNQVSLLRKKLPSDCIKSIYGIGYIFL